MEVPTWKIQNVSRTAVIIQKILANANQNNTFDMKVDDETTKQNENNITVDVISHSGNADGCSNKISEDSDEDRLMIDDDPIASVNELRKFRKIDSFDIHSIEIGSSDYKGSNDSPVQKLESVEFPSCVSPVLEGLSSRLEEVVSEQSLKAFSANSFYSFPKGNNDVQTTTNVLKLQLNPSVSSSNDTFNQESNSVNTSGRSQQLIPKRVSNCQLFTCSSPEEVETTVNSPLFVKREERLAEIFLSHTGVMSLQSVKKIATKNVERKWAHQSWMGVFHVLQKSDKFTCDHVSNLWRYVDVQTNKKLETNASVVPVSCAIDESDRLKQDEIGIVRKQPQLTPSNKFTESIIDASFAPLNLPTSDNIQSYTLPSLPVASVPDNGASLLNESCTNESSSIIKSSVELLATQTSESNQETIAADLTDDLGSRSLRVQCDRTPITYNEGLLAHVSVTKSLHDYHVTNQIKTPKNEIADASSDYLNVKNISSAVKWNMASSAKSSASTCATHRSSKMAPVSNVLFTLEKLSLKRVTPTRDKMGISHNTNHSSWRVVDTDAHNSSQSPIDNSPVKSTTSNSCSSKVVQSQIKEILSQMTPCKTPANPLRLEKNSRLKKCWLNKKDLFKNKNNTEKTAVKTKKKKCLPDFTLCLRGGGASLTKVSPPTCSSTKPRIPSSGSGRVSGNLTALSNLASSLINVDGSFVKQEVLVEKKIEAVQEIKMNARKRKSSTEQTPKIRRKWKQNSAIDLDKLMEPLTLGWVREIVFRSTDDPSGKRMSDCYYFAPFGNKRKLRSNVEVDKFLTDENVYDLTSENFLFSRFPLNLGEPWEIIRDAGRSAGRSRIAKKRNLESSENLTPSPNELRKKKQKLDTPLISSLPEVEVPVDDQNGVGMEFTESSVKENICQVNIFEDLWGKSSLPDDKLEEKLDLPTVAKKTTVDYAAVVQHESSAKTNGKAVLNTMNSTSKHKKNKGIPSQQKTVNMKENEVIPIQQKASNMNSNEGIPIQQKASNMNSNEGIPIQQKASNMNSNEGIPIQQKASNMNSNEGIPIQQKASNMNTNEGIQQKTANMEASVPFMENALVKPPAGLEPDDSSRIAIRIRDVMSINSFYSESNVSKEGVVRAISPPMTADEIIGEFVAVDNLENRDNDSDSDDDVVYLTEGNKYLNLGLSEDLFVETGILTSDNCPFAISQKQEAMEDDLPGVGNIVPIWDLSLEEGFPFRNSVASKQPCTFRQVSVPAVRSAPISPLVAVTNHLILENQSGQTSFDTPVVCQSIIDMDPLTTNVRTTVMSPSSCQPIISTFGMQVQPTGAVNWCLTSIPVRPVGSAANGIGQRSVPILINSQPNIERLSSHIQASIRRDQIVSPSAQNNNPNMTVHPSASIKSNSHPPGFSQMPTATGSQIRYGYLSGTPQNFQLTNSEKFVESNIMNRNMMAREGLRWFPCPSTFRPRADFNLPALYSSSCAVNPQPHYQVLHPPPYRAPPPPYRASSPLPYRAPGPISGHSTYLPAVSIPIAIPGSSLTEEVGLKSQKLSLPLQPEFQQKGVRLDNNLFR